MTTELYHILLKNVILFSRPDQTPLSDVSPGKYTFSFKGAKNVPIKGVDDKRHVTSTFAVTFAGIFLTIQLMV